MRDELEEARHEIERMHKLETLLEKYKRKLEDTADLKRQIKVSSLNFRENFSAHTLDRHLRNKTRACWSEVIKSRMNIAKCWPSRP